MYLPVAGATNDKRFPLSRCHQLHPCWLFSSSFNLKICKFSDMVNFHILRRFTDFTLICQKSLKDFCACVYWFWKLVPDNPLRLRDKLYSPKLRHEWVFSLSFYTHL
jgi:hypothetical protein